jgi:hypothetical protein
MNPKFSVIILNYNGWENEKIFNKNTILVALYTNNGELFLKEWLEIKNKYKNKEVIKVLNQNLAGISIIY